MGAQTDDIRASTAQTQQGTRQGEEMFAYQKTAAQRANELAERQVRNADLPQINSGMIVDPVTGRVQVMGQPGLPDAYQPKPRTIVPGRIPVDGGDTIGGQPVGSVGAAPPPQPEPVPASAPVPPASSAPVGSFPTLPPEPAKDPNGPRAVPLPTGSYPRDPRSIVGSAQMLSQGTNLEPIVSTLLESPELAQRFVRMVIDDQKNKAANAVTTASPMGALVSGQRALERAVDRNPEIPDRSEPLGLPAGYYAKRFDLRNRRRPQTTNGVPYQP
jgi:hypothetical protein